MKQDTRNGFADVRQGRGAEGRVTAVVDGRGSSCEVETEESGAKTLFTHTLVSIAPLLCRKGEEITGFLFLATHPVQERPIRDRRPREPGILAGELLQVRTDGTALAVLRVEVAARRVVDVEHEVTGDEAAHACGSSGGSGGGPVGDVGTGADVDDGVLAAEGIEEGGSSEVAAVDLHAGREGGGGGWAADDGDGKDAGIQESGDDVRTEVAGTLLERSETGELKGRERTYQWS